MNWNDQRDARRDGYRPDPASYSYGRPYAQQPAVRGGGLLRRVSWAMALTGLAVWSLLAIAGFVLVDPVLAWLANAAGVVLAGGNDAANVLGLGELGGVLFDTANASGIPELILGLLNLFLKPAIVLVWLVGAVILVALPLIAGKLAQIRLPRRY